MTESWLDRHIPEMTDVDAEDELASDGFCRIAVALQRLALGVLLGALVMVWRAW